ncbi:MAG: hypothetical protein HYZ57_13435 [Acidobacteria bacterium]|nr:hypothetical protein [Acidobacteriota bacterium]MBI3280835.1 hypothetical protein [Acidobacteriota bacterium]
MAKYLTNPKLFAAAAVLFVVATILGGSSKVEPTYLTLSSGDSAAQIQAQR